MHDTYLQIGSHGHEVVEWQTKLNLLAPGSVAEDGVFGEHTHDATVRFQEHHLLTPDGVVGPHTHTAMEHAVAAAHYGTAEQHPHAGVTHHEEAHAVAHHEQAHAVAHHDEAHAVAHHEQAHAVAHHDEAHAVAHAGSDDDEKPDGGKHEASLSVHVSAGAEKDDKKDGGKDDDKADAKGGVSLGVSASVDLNKLLDQLAAGWHALVNAGVGVLTCTPLHMTTDLTGLHMRGQHTAKLTYRGQNDNVHASKPRAPEYGSSTVPLHVTYDYGTDGRNQLPTSVHVATGDGAVASPGSKITVQVTTYKAAPLEAEADGHKIDIGALYLAVDIKEECTFAHDAHSSCMLCIYGDGRAVMVTPDQFVTFEEH